MSSSEEKDSSIRVSTEKSLPLTSPVYAPSFYISHGEKYQNQTFCIPSDGSHHDRSVPEIRGMKCIGSCYGWLILQSFFSDECYLFNPVMLNKIQLPALPCNSFDHVVLTTSPTDPKCVIMSFSERKWLCIFCRVGDEKWIQQELIGQNDDVPVDEYYSAVSSNGKIYLSFFNGVAIIDVRDNFAVIEVYETALHPPSSRLYTGSWETYLVESCEDLFQVYMLSLGCLDIFPKFLVFKLDLSNMIWKKVETLGDRIFLLGSSSVSLPATEFGTKGNCIYFFDKGRTELSSFDMEDGAIAITQLCPSKLHLWDGPFWVVPNCTIRVKKEVADVTEEIQVTSSNLLPELLEMIFRFLHLDGIIRFRFAIKAFISRNLPVRSIHSQDLSNSPNIPWLISLPITTKQICHFYHPIYTDVYSMNLPQLKGATVRHAKFGWLLMSVRIYSIFFFNPLTLEIIKLSQQPPPDCESYFESISFSSPPTSSDCVVFGLTLSHDYCLRMSAYRKIQDRWSMHILRNQPYTFLPSTCNPVFHNGVFYCLSKDGKLGIFNPNETNEEDTWKVYTHLQDVRVTNPSLILEDSTRSFIMECDGEIFSVFVGLLGNPVCVYKLDESSKKMKWSMVTCLGNRVMFLSHTTSLLILAVLKGTENRIYLPRFKKNASVFYSLSSRNYHSFMNPDYRADWIDTTESWNCTWFLTD